MTLVELGFDISLLVEEMNKEDWEDSPDSEYMEIRRIYLGTVFNLTPSGKYYMPWACSNLNPCDDCKGTGAMPLHCRRRVEKRWKARHKRILNRFDKLYGSTNGVSNLHNRAAAFAFIDRQQERFRTRHLPYPTCMACGGLGSREAYLDQLWNDAVERALDENGLCLESGEGDPCDLFVAQYRDKPVEDGGFLCVASPASDM